MNKQVELLRQLEEAEKKRLGRESREALVSKIVKELGDDRLLRLYRCKKERTGYGLAPILDGVCLRCGMHYPDTHHVIQKLQTEVVCCEFCGRIAFPAPPDFRLPERAEAKKPAASSKAEAATVAPGPSGAVEEKKPPRKRKAPAKKKTGKRTPVRQKRSAPARGARKKKVSRAGTARAGKGPKKAARKTPRKAAAKRGRPKPVVKKKSASRKKAQKKRAGRSRSTAKKTARRA
ncbi:MAG: hypothetical protein ABIH26_08670 [Candidatus Eisenbacteria bacterium]